MSGELKNECGDDEHAIICGPCGISACTFFVKKDLKRYELRCCGCGQTVFDRYSTDGEPLQELVDLDKMVKPKGVKNAPVFNIITKLKIST